MKHISIFCLIAFSLFSGVSVIAQKASGKTEPTDAEEAAAEKAAADILLEKAYQKLVGKLTPEQQIWEITLQENLGHFYLPIHKREKILGRSNAWDYVKDNPELPRVLLIGDSVSRAYTLGVRKLLAGKANVHRAPANCGPTTTGLKKMSVWLGDKKWDFIHFNFGIHDRKTPLAEYSERLEQIVDILTKTGAKVTWASTTPIPDVAETKQTAASIVERNKAASEIMKKHGIAIDDLFTYITPHIKTAQRPDDVHFTPEGYQLLSEAVAAFIEKELK